MARAESLGQESKLEPKLWGSCRIDSGLNSGPKLTLVGKAEDGGGTRIESTWSRGEDQRTRNTMYLKCFYFFLSL